MKNDAPRKVNPERLERFVSSAFQRVGVPLSDADLTAKILVDADRRGIDSHGVINLYGTYIKGILDGSINRRPHLLMETGGLVS
jgi:LDH2 family malate/lactate/ureidoglycolate dehydrogenase